MMQIFNISRATVRQGIENLVKEGVLHRVQGKGTFTVGEEKIVADEKSCILCDPMVPHGFSADKGEKLVVMAVVTPAE